MINLSSLSGIRQCPGLIIYGACKKFDYVFSNMIRDQWRKTSSLNDVTIQSVHPGYVSTKMTNYASNFQSCKVDETVSGSLKDLGSLDLSYGSFVHNLMGL